MEEKNRVVPGEVCAKRAERRNHSRKAMTGWLNYYAIASMKQRMAQWDKWLRHRIRAYIWKQWKKPKTKLKNLIKLGIPEYFAHMAANSQRGYWFTATQEP